MKFMSHAPMGHLKNLTGFTLKGELYTLRCLNRVYDSKSNIYITTHTSGITKITKDGLVDLSFSYNTKFSGPYPLNGLEVLSDDSLILYGNFTSYGGVSGRKYLIKVTEYGEIDEIFSSNITFSSSADLKYVYEQLDGKLVVGGHFSDYGFVSGRSFLIRLNSDGTVDENFCLNAVDGKFGDINSINYIKQQPDGKLLIAGDFLLYANQSNYNYLIRLNSDGTLDSDFCTEVSTKFSGSPSEPPIKSIKVLPNGDILIGMAEVQYDYDFNSYTIFIKLNSLGVLDTSFYSNTSLYLNSNFGINTISINSDGTILAGGTSGGLYKINSNGTRDLEFQSQEPWIYHVSSYVNNKIYCFYSSKAFLLNQDGSIFSQIPLGRNRKFSSSTSTVTPLSNGKILISGNFNNFAGTAGRNKLICCNPDGTLDTQFCNNAVDNIAFNSSIETISPHRGGIVVGGGFSSYKAVSNRSRLIRLNLDGTLDTSFCVNASDAAKFNNTVRVVTAQADGKILVGGSFSNYAGTTGRNRLIRLNVDGTLDTSFCVNASDGNKFGSDVSSLLIQADGKILVGGYFINYAGTTGRNRLIRLNVNGTLDTSFCVNASDGSKFSALASTYQQSDGKILAFGFFNNYAGTTGRNRLIRLNVNGTLDTSFCVNASDGSKFSNFVLGCKEVSENKILVCGSFTNYSSNVGLNYLVKLNNDGTLDTSFVNNNLTANVLKMSSYRSSNAFVGVFDKYTKKGALSYYITLDDNGEIVSPHELKPIKQGLSLYLDSGKYNSYPGTGNTWSDLSGNSNNITLYNSPNYYGGGGGYFSFDGTTHSGYTPHNISSIQYCTISVWFRDSTSVATHRGPFWISDSSNRFIFLDIRSDTNYLQISTENKANNRKATTSQPQTIDSNWHNVTIIRNDSAISVYLDNALISLTQSDGYNSWGVSPSDLSVGALLDSGAIYSRWAGSLSLLLIYNRVLSSEEVTRNYRTMKLRHL